MQDSDPPSPPDTDVLPRRVNAPSLGDGKSIAPRSAAFQRFMAAPFIFGALLMAATAVLAILSWTGGKAEGQRADIVFTGACLAEARTVVEQRAEAIGLGDPRWSMTDGRLLLTATLPGLADDLQAVPALLSAPGEFFVSGPSGTIVDRTLIDGAQVRLDETGSAFTWIDLKPDGVQAITDALEADRDGHLTVRIDQTSAQDRPNTRGVTEDGIRVIPNESDPRQRMRVATDFAIALSMPLPCALTVASATAVAPPANNG